MANKPLIVFFKDIDKEDVPLVGGTGANLGEMVKIGMPVPNGFAITVNAYDQFLDENDIEPEIEKVVKETDVTDPDELMRASKNIQKKIMNSKVPKEVAKESITAYRKICGRFKKSYVAVRSSATAEDLPGASFAGQQATFLNIRGETNLIEALKGCWASLFTARAIFYRHENKIQENKVKISVIIQKMVQSEVSGVMFSMDPVTNEKDRIIIEAVWGLGELIVQGSIVPDTYKVQKGTFDILSKEISDQAVELIKKGEKTKQTDVAKAKRDAQKISDDEIIKLAKISDKLQSHYYFPQDTEWAKEKGKLYIVQTRPVTTIGSSKKALKERGDGKMKLAENPIVKGAPASPGIGIGEVIILKSPKEIDKVKAEDVLVTKMTSPDFVPAMKKASAIVTDEGGLTSHAAIVSRELGVPCVVGTKNATKTLKDGMMITVDGTRGIVFMGGKIKVEKLKDEKPKVKINKHLRTATKVYVNLAEPERASEVAKENVDGVGLLRAEFMIANIGIHPKEAIKKKKQDDFIKKLARDMRVFCKSFHPRPVVYRATDFKTNEYRDLPGGEAWEPHESNPMLGFRGAYRYVANPEVFNLELQAIKKVREEYNNLWLMIPFVRSPEELAKVRRIIAAEELFKYSSFKLWMMVELPVNVIKLADFIKVGIDGVSIGSNDLTMLLLGTDRDNSEVAEAFDERSPVVRWALKRTIRICNKHGISSSICGQAPSTYDDLVKSLVKYGITSISVNPDAIDRVRQVISDAEKEIMKP
jgi:pyruvate,water dikinase